MAKKKRSSRATADVKAIEREVGREVKVVEKNLGHLAFIAGVIVAIIAGIASDLLQPEVVPLVLVILGTVVGFMNITTKETVAFLVATIALMLANVADVTIIPWIGIYLKNIISNIGTFVAPAAIVVAIKTVKKLAED
jgi:ATP synthase protein I